MYLIPTLPYLDTFNQEFQKTIATFEINDFKFTIMQSFKLKKKNKVLTKLPYLGIFGLEFEKAIVMFETSTFEFVKI